MDAPSVESSNERRIGLCEKRREDQLGGSVPSDGLWPVFDIDRNASGTDDIEDWRLVWLLAVPELASDVCDDLETRSRDSCELDADDDAEDARVGRRNGTARSLALFIPGARNDAGLTTSFCCPFNSTGLLVRMAESRE